MTAQQATAAAPPNPARTVHAPQAESARRARGPQPLDTHAEGRDPVRDNPVVADLVTRARNGDKQAWDDLVEKSAIRPRFPAG